MQYQYQIDYGSGYEDVFRDGQKSAAEDGNLEDPSHWLAEVELETAARRARVLLGGSVVEERDFTCTVSQNSVQPDGSSEYLVRCYGGSITVKGRSGGEMTGFVDSGFVGDADAALERAFEAVRKLNEPLPIQKN